MKRTQVDPERVKSDVGLETGRLPRHVAIIMDGNGRWAQQRGWIRVRGHREGVRAVRSTTTEAARLGVDWLTLYAFSSENWSRPEREIDYLMGLLVDFMDGELETMQENDIRFRVIGDTARLPQSVRDKIAEDTLATRANQGLTLTLALSYGGRDEVLHACRRLAERVAAGELAPEAIDAAAFGAELYDPEAPDVDLLIRTAGEQRVSNFLIWQSVYAEYVSVAPFWPEFTVADFHAALREYQNRERRFGKVRTSGPSR